MKDAARTKSARTTLILPPSSFILYTFALHHVVDPVRLQSPQRLPFPVRPRDRHVGGGVTAEAYVLFLRVHGEIADGGKDLAPHSLLRWRVDGDLRADGVARHT